MPGLDIVPATSDLAGAEMELVDDPRPPVPAARRAGAVRRKAYDFVLIDCPPSLGLLTVNALVAAHAVLVPLQCEFFALEGLSQLLRTIERVRQSLNPILALEGMVLTMFDRRNNLSEQVAADVRGIIGDTGLRHGDPAQRAGLRGAEPRQAGAALRPALARCPSLCAPGGRDASARARRGRDMSGGLRRSGDFATD